MGFIDTDAKNLLMDAQFHFDTYDLEGQVLEFHLSDAG